MYFYLNSIFSFYISRGGWRRTPEADEAIWLLSQSDFETLFNFFYRAAPIFALCFLLSMLLLFLLINSDKVWTFWLLIKKKNKF